MAIFHKYCCHKKIKLGGIITNLTMKSLGVCYWYDKIPQCRYMEHGLEYILWSKAYGTFGGLFWIPTGLRRAARNAGICETHLFLMYALASTMVYLNQCWLGFNKDLWHSSQGYVSQGIMSQPLNDQPSLFIWNEVEFLCAYTLKHNHILWKRYHGISSHNAAQDIGMPPGGHILLTWMIYHMPTQIQQNGELWAPMDSKFKFKFLYCLLYKYVTSRTNTIKVSNGKWST